MSDQYFIKQVDVDEPVETIFGWHENLGAFERLTPPWMRLKNIDKSGDGIKVGAKVSMDICFGGVPFPIRAEHIGYEKNIFFKDRLYGGIFSKWEHTHKFFNLSLDISNKSNKLSMLEDRIDYNLYFHVPNKLHNLIKSEIYRLFNYRHTVMVNDLKRHKDFSHILNSNPNLPRNLTFLISGASGPVGNSLIPFLTTGGHRVIKLVRRKSQNSDEIEWNPYKGELDLLDFIDCKSSDRSKCKSKYNNNKIDVVINLNGYNIGSGRWTEKAKEMIVKSRNLSTKLLADKISTLPKELRPAAFISASATGFYGDCGDSCVDENSCSGDLFISEVCKDWESCAKKAQDCGIRTVFARMGVVLTPAGGALERLLPAFMVGLGAQIGSGNQYMSWISMDDLIYALYHIVQQQEIDGAINLISPNPVTNKEFTATLADVLSRPAPFKIPEKLIHILWGKMGEEILLASTRVVPEKLVGSGFRFSYPKLEEALRHLIGKDYKK
ncbi:MAG: TIGR01777 family protein [Desulfamplus sp.]|nr:TIGR01777 family protein [Desulfamplus sp.]